MNSREPHREDGARVIGAREYSWSRIVAFAREHRRALIVANVIAVGSVLAGVPIPLLLPLLVDEVLLDKPGFLLASIQALFPAAWHGPVLYVLVIAALTAGLRFVSMALAVIETRRFVMIAKEIVFRIRGDLIERLKHISMAEYEALGGANVSSRLVVDLETVDEFVGLSVSRFIVAVLQLVGVALVLFWVHWQLAVLVLLLNPAAIYCTVLMGKRVAGLKRRENSAFEAFQQSVSETLEAIHQVRAANREQHYFSRLVASAGHIRAHSAEFSWRSDASARLSFFFFVFGLDIFRAVAMLMVIFSDLSIGEMFAVFGYLWYMLSPVQEVLNMQYKFSAADAALDRVNGLLRLEQEPAYAPRSNPFEGAATNAIELREVSFSYRGGAPVLEAVSLSVGRGEKVAIVGESGGGKSTLVQVLLGLYAPSSGEILFDGVPVSEIGLDVVRRHVGVVLQSPVLFNASVRENLLMGRSADDAALWDVLAGAELADMVREMPDGLETVVGRSGIRLSGGQKQRLAIARMLLADPRVLLLDEATSALDTDTEARVHAALAERLSGKTMLIIAHRISAVRMADRVYVMERGRVVQQGRHETLIEAPGVYRKLYGAAAPAAEKKSPRGARAVSHVELGTTEG